MNALQLISGIEIRESIYATSLTQTRFPRTKKRRIQKKWRKDRRNFSSKPAMFKIAPNVLLAHPDVIRALRATIDKNEQRWQEKWG